MALVEERIHDGWTELRLNRPEKRNALSMALADELVAAIGRATSIGPGLVLAANGPVYSAGADLAEGISLSHDRPSRRILDALLATPLFVVAELDGGVYGAGVSLLAACPVIVATSAATFGLPEVRRGFFPVGVAPYLEGAIPRRRLLDLAIHGSAVDAQTALDHGVITSVVERDQLRAASEHWMELVTQQPTVAAQAKRWWSEPLEAPAFRARVADLEALLAESAPVDA